MASPTKKKTIEQNKLREHPLSVVKDEKPAIEEQPQSKWEHRIFEDILETTMKDPSGFICAIDHIRISSVVRMSFNAVMGELTLILSETAGKTEEIKVPTYHPKTGLPSGERWAISGYVASFKTTINDIEVIKQILAVWLPKKAGAAFEGFKAHEAAQKVITETMEKKKAEHEGRGKILTAEGEVAKHE